MPIYEYQCTCGHRFETLQRVDDPKPSCPKCKDGQVTKLLSQFEATFVGKGFHVNDYPTGGKKCE
jgi:putative FmdB family regulatory protein